MSKSKSPLSSWDAMLQRRHEFCERFVREQYPGIAGIKGAHPLKPLGGPNYLRDGNGNMAVDWWLQTNDSMSALGFVWLAHLFGRRRLYDHAWMIGRSDQEAWALVSEPYFPPAVPDAIEALRQELEQVGAELLEYPSEQSTHYPGGNVAVLVANVLSIHTLVGTVARQIVAACPPFLSDDDEELAEPQRSTATHLKYLGVGDAATTMGAIEYLATQIKDGMDRLSSAIESLSEPLRSDHPLQGQTLDGIESAFGSIADAIEDAKDGTPK